MDDERAKVVRPSRAFASTTQQLCRLSELEPDPVLLNRISRHLAAELASHLLPSHVNMCNVAVLSLSTAEHQQLGAATRKWLRQRHGKRPPRETAKEAGRQQRLNRRLTRARADGETSALADHAALLAERLWAELVSPAAALGSEEQRDGKAALHTFYSHAVAGDVTRDHVTDKAARAFAIDKWPARCDKMCCALLCLAERSPRWPQPHQPALLRVASIGGGPANDAFGAFVFAALSEGHWQRVEATVYDFSESWRPLCLAIAQPAVLSAAALLLSEAGGASDAELEFTLGFELADLRAAAGSAVNALLIDAVDHTDLFLFSHVVREAQATAHELLPALLRASLSGSVFVFLDMQWADLQQVWDLVDIIELQDGCTMFEPTRLGESEDYGFFGLAFIKK